MAWLVALGVLAVPTVQAQGEPHGEWLVPEGPHAIVPETGTVNLELEFRYHCDVTAADPAQIHFRFQVGDVPPFAVALLSPTSTSMTSLVFQEDWCGAPDQYIVVPTTLITTITRQAPAYIPFHVTVSAVVEYGQGSTHTVDGPYNETVTFESTYFARIEAIPDTTLVKVAPGATAQFPVDLANYGNGPTVIHAAWRPTALADAPEHSAVEPLPSDVLDVSVPDPLVLQSVQMHGAAADDEARVFVQVTAPRTGSLEYTNQVYAFVVDFSGAYDGNRTDATNNQTVFLSVQVQGTGNAPAPAAVVGFAALAVAFLAARRRQ